jgi:hypothetical protein
MPLHGTFDTIQLADVVQWIHASRISGTLSVSVETDETYLVFENGDLAAVGSDEPSAAAVSAGQVFETVLDLFFHEEGSFHLSTSPASAGFLAEPGGSRMTALPAPIPTAEMLVEAMRRIDEWRRFREIMPSSYTVVAAAGGTSDNPAWLELRRAGEPLSVGALCLRLPLSRFAVHRLLFEAHQQGLVVVDRLGGGQSGPAHPIPLNTLIDSARVLLEEQQFDEAREILTTALGLDPDATVARSLLRELRQAQLGYLYQQIPPHRVPVVAASRAQLAAMDLSPREAFLVSRLSGRIDVATLVVATPLGEIETLRILRKLLHAGVARLT